MTENKEGFERLIPTELSETDKRRLLEVANLVLAKGDCELEESSSYPDKVMVAANGECNAVLVYVTYKRLADLYNSQQGQFTVENFRDQLETLGVWNRFQP